MAEAEQVNLTTLTVDLLSAYVANNTVSDGDLAALIRSTHSALKSIEAPEPELPAEPEHQPAVSVRKSLSSKTHIISLIDGKPYQTLKRHLSRYNLTPAEYRERYGLPKTYPMVAPAYSESRRAIAKKLGLGRKAKDAQAAAPAVAAEVESSETKPAKTAKTGAKAKPGRIPYKAAKAAPAAPAGASEEAAPAPAVKAPRARKAAAPVGKAAPAPKTSSARAKKAVATEAPVAKPARAKRGAAKAAETA